MLRLLPGGSDKPLEYKKRRATYMNYLLQSLKQRIKDGTDVPCISGNVLKDPEAKLSDAEIMSIGLTMVSAGLDTVPGNLIMCIAYLSTPHGQEIQERALKEINEQYPNNDSWEKCLVEEKCEFITALVKETLRFWSVIPICLPRTSIKDIKWGDAVIPAGTSFYMNAYGAHYDESHFKSPFEFNPDRYMAGKSRNMPLCLMTPRVQTLIPSQTRQSMTLLPPEEHHTTATELEAECALVRISQTVNYTPHSCA